MVPNDHAESSTGSCAPQFGLKFLTELFTLYIHSEFGAYKHFRSDHIAKKIEILAVHLHACSKLLNQKKKKCIRAKETDITSILAIPQWH
jgi:hypothetical protein